MASNLPILIAGGGIGGLAAALALSRNGFKVQVLERSRAFGEIGAGVQLGPNAFNAFDRLGVGDAARGIAVYVDRLRMMDALTAEEIAHIPLEESFRKRFGNPYAVVHRGEMHGVLFNACQADPNIELSVSSEVVDYDQDGATVAAALSNGEVVRGSALIGADGLWSKVRAKLAADGPPRVSGHSSYRSVIPVEAMPEDLRWNAATLWAGPHCHIVHYPLSGWKVFNLVCTYHSDAPEVVAGQPVTKEEVGEGFQHVHPMARQIISHGSDWKLWVTCDRDPITKWTDGRVVLLGDAAHPMLQYFAQGACMALEDAVQLGDSVADFPGDLAAAFEDYNLRRVNRTTRVQLQSRELGKHVYHPEGAHAVLRNAVMQAKSAEDWYETLGWLYDGGNAAASASRA